MDKKELNEAIYNVLISQFKKDNPEAFKKVEEAGYVIKKWDGHFNITNPNNIVNEYDHAMCISCTDNGYKFYFNTTNNRGRKFSHKIDFVNCLEKRREKYYLTVIESQAIDNYKYKIKNLKQSIKYNKEDIAKKKKKILELIEEIEDCSRYIAEYEVELEANRKELGLNN